MKMKHFSVNFVIFILFHLTYSVSGNGYFRNFLVPQRYPLNLVEVEPELQQFTFYSNADYTGDSETFTQSVNDVQGSTQVGKVAKSFCIDKGVWVVYGNLTRSKQDAEINIDPSKGILVNSHLGRICLSLHDEGNGISVLYTRVHHLASNNLRDVSLSLFNQSFRGEELFVLGNSVRLPSPILVKSFAFTGNTPWTLYSGRDETGDSFCLPLGGEASDPFLQGLSFADFQEPVLLGSAKQGCDGKAADYRSTIISVRKPQGLTAF